MKQKSIAKEAQVPEETPPLIYITQVLACTIKSKDNIESQKKTIKQGHGTRGY
jgi:hypothetical protein